MYDDTILPVRNKVRIPSRTQARIYFVQDQTKKSLIFLKWVELAICLLCLGLTLVATYVVNLTILNTIITVTANLIGTLLVLAQITYPRIKRYLPLLFQMLEAGINFAIYGILTIIIYQVDNDKLAKILFFTHGLATVLFLIDLICKFIISTYLYQTTKVKSVVDVGVSAFFHSPSPTPAGRPKLHRSVLTATPITYGGTFPIGKNQPPFLPEERILVSEERSIAEKGNLGSRSKSVQTTHHGDSKSVGGSTFNFVPTPVEKLIARGRIVQTNLDQEDKGNSTQPPFYLTQERIKKSPWTCSSPSTSRKIEARKLTCMSTPITYSGTFAVNRDLVPIVGNSSSSPKTSPRSKKLSSRSEGSSPRRSEKCYLNVARLDQISEEKLSLKASETSCPFYDMTVLPGSTLEDGDSLAI